MKRFIAILFIVINSGCNFEEPTYFSAEALNDTLISLDGNEYSLAETLERYKGKTILIDVWATWCKDCFVNLPVVKALQKQHPDVVFLFLSEDRSETAWKGGISKYQITGEHYFIKSGKDGPFADFLNSNWIPRYMVIDKEGKIKLFKAKKATDKRIKEALL
jgi:thiol-disulfide isomerase/thioredoxin